MKKYEKPMLQVIELQVNEAIAALVPQDLYKKNSGSTSSFGSSSAGGNDLADIEAYGTSNATV